MNITFIGFGSMAKAIAQGLIAQKGHVVSASAPSLPLGINSDGIKTYGDNIQAIHGAQVIILAVKPMQMAYVLQEIMPYLKSNVCLISVAAGLSLEWFERLCSKPIAIIRTMPNIGAQVNAAATPMIANTHTSLKQKQRAELIFSSIGIITWLKDESDMDSFTALSGSGPAYIFLFLEAMIDAAMSLGLEKKIAYDFTFQTMKGALKLAEKSDLDISQLRARVTSAKGTTAAALAVLNPELPDLLSKALVAAKSRAKELENENK